MLCVTKLFFGGQSTQCFNGLGLRLSKCQHFQEMSTKPGTVSTISGRLSTRSGNRLSTTSGNKQKTVNRNQEKTQESNKVTVTK